MRQTTNVKHQKVNKKWYVVDAEGQTLGRLATFVASYLRGKHKPSFTPNVDMGDNMIIINASKIVLSANKIETKLYRHHSGYPGGLKTINAKTLNERQPGKIVEKAIYGMIPHTKLGNRQRTNLYVYPSSEHQHWAQNPQTIEVK